MSDKHEEIADKFLALGYSEGRIVEHSVFWNLFGIPEPSGYMHAKEFKRLSFAFATAMDGLQKALLKRGHDLQNSRTKGYRLVPFHDRPKELYADGMRVVRKVTNHTLARAKSIPNRTQLSGEAKALLDHAITVFGHYRAIARARKKSFYDETTEPAGSRY